MKTDGGKFWPALAAVIFFIVVASDRAQQGTLDGVNSLHAPSGFTSDMYFEPPHDQQVKMRLSGASASPLPGGLLDVKSLKVEVFNTNGVSQLVALAPQCTYAPLDGVASSAGRLELQTGDGKFRVAGDGFLFLWRQGQSTLAISNHVQTAIESGFLKP